MASIPLLFFTVACAVSDLSVSRTWKAMELCWRHECHRETDSVKSLSKILTFAVNLRFDCLYSSNSERFVYFSGCPSRRDTTWREVRWTKLTRRSRESPGTTANRCRWDAWSTRLARPTPRYVQLRATLYSLSLYLMSTVLRSRVTMPPMHPWISLFRIQ